jgi:hypothetical protein
MGKALQRILENPVMVAILATAFTISMLLFWHRVRRERNGRIQRETNPPFDGNT